MVVWMLGVAVALAVAPGPSAADAATLKDGAVVLGQVVESTPRGPLLMVVRREWADARLPDRAAKWRAAEAPARQRARSQRIGRLKAWKRERVPEAGHEDAIAAWIDAEWARLAGEKGPDRTRLAVVALDRREVKALTRRPPDLARLLRLGWRCNFRDTEEMAPADLKAAVEGRGFLPAGPDPVRLDDLLPMPVEPEARWLARRAATEVLNEPGLRFVRYQGLVLPEGQPVSTAGAADALGALKGLLGEQPAEDPLAAITRKAAERGRIGLVLTALNMAPDFSEVKVESTLWVRSGSGPSPWQSAAARAATVRPDELKAEAGAELGADPQVQAALRIVEGLGLGAVDPGLKDRSLKVGAASRRALHQAQGALDGDLQEWAIPIEEGPKPAPR